MNAADNASIIIDAPAKLTLSLRVTGVREDGFHLVREDGFHLIDAEMITLNLVDKVRITPDEDGLNFDGPFSSGISTNSDNLVSRALALAGRRARVHIEKNIPSGGGLGGGSADAAAILKWAGFTDLEAASRLGADIPFCMIGGRARVQGIGEVIDILPPVHREITLVIPPFGVSTPAVYRAWDDLEKAGNNTTNDQNHLQQAAACRISSMGRLGKGWQQHHERSKPSTASRTCCRAETARMARQNRPSVWSSTDFGGQRVYLVARRSLFRIGKRPAKSNCCSNTDSLSGPSAQASDDEITCGAGGGYDEASSCASFCASACGGVLQVIP